MLDLPGIDLSRIRFIRGAPPGVCAALTVHRDAETHKCEKCHEWITRSDGEVWYCSKNLLSKGNGLAYWHRDCLEPGPVSIGQL